MHHATAAVVPQRALRPGLIVFGLIIAFLASAVLGLASPMRAAPLTATTSAGATESTTRLKAVIIVGPTHGFTSSFLTRGEALAKSAESYGMDVRRVFHPRATAQRVLANIQGAHLIAYIGHGNGWPSPYGPYQEKTKNGFGLNPVDGGPQNDVQYYGGNWIRNNVVLAPGAVTLFNGLCYAAGNAESGMAIPGWDVARQRVDNFAAAFLAVGSKGVFAYSWQPGAHVIKMLHTTNKTFAEIFETTGSQRHPSYGFIGWDARKFDSVRSPGFKNYLDPHSKEGFLRAFSGDLKMTAGQWAASGGSTGPGGGDTVTQPTPTPTPKASPTPTPTPKASPTPTPTPKATPTPTPPPALAPSDSTPPTVPQALATEALGYRRVNISWKASTDNSGGPLKYRVLRNGTRVATVTTTSYVDRPATAGTYKYKVRAVDPSGNRSAFTPVVLGDSIKGALPPGSPVVIADKTPPSVPQGMTGKAASRGYVKLSWQASTDDRPGTIRYRVFRNGVRIGSVTTTSFTDRPRDEGSFKYNVRAVDVAGNKSALSRTVTVRIDDDDDDD
jgi:hypothetical protein